MASSLQAPPPSVKLWGTWCSLTVGHICRADPRVGFCFSSVSPLGGGGDKKAASWKPPLFFVWFVSLSAIDLPGPITVVGAGLSVGRMGTALAS